MLSLIKRVKWLKNKIVKWTIAPLHYCNIVLSQKGFSLVEAMVASAIMSLGFVGVYTLVATSEQLMTHSIAREKAQMIADQILDVVSTDVSNITSYNMNISTCVNPGGGASQALTRGYEWCMRLNNELGPVTATDRRSITVTAMDTRQLVYVLIEGYSRKVQVVMSRIYED